MNDPIEHAWGAAVDSADAGIPEFPVGCSIGTVFETEGRRWLLVHVAFGVSGARWAYWKDQSLNWIIADKIFNADATHFAGMLAAPFGGGLPGRAWIMIEPKIREIPPEPITVEPQAPEARYERSKEVFDVATGQTEILP